jgi:hypothetical protein
MIAHQMNSLLLVFLSVNKPPAEERLSALKEARFRFALSKWEANDRRTESARQGFWAKEVHEFSRFRENSGKSSQKALKSHFFSKKNL